MQALPNDMVDRAADKGTEEYGTVSYTMPANLMMLLTTFVYFSLCEGEGVLILVLGRIRLERVYSREQIYRDDMALFALYITVCLLWGLGFQESVEKGSYL